MPFLFSFVNAGWVYGQLSSWCGPAALSLMSSELLLPTTAIRTAELVSGCATRTCVLRVTSEYLFTDLGRMNN